MQEQVPVWFKTGCVSLHYQVRPSRDDFRNFCCRGSHCVHLCIVWPKLSKRNFTTSSLGNHTSVHISQANQPLSIPSEFCSICWSDKSEKPLQTCCSQAFLSRISSSFTIKEMSLLPLTVKAKFLLYFVGMNMLLLPSTTIEHRKVKQEAEMVQRMERGRKLKGKKSILDC